MRLRGLFGARDEFLLAAIVQNLKTRRFDPLVHPSRSRAPLLPETYGTIRPLPPKTFPNLDPPLIRGNQKKTDFFDSIDPLRKLI